MTVAFLTGALASGFTAAGLSTLLIWIATVVTGSSDPWGWAPSVVALVAVAFTAATYVAERIAHRRTLATMRSTGEPWAYRDQG
jgi:hypothetical protein